MKICVASGKGGTGKTTVAVNLAVILSRNGNHVQLLDCDVEEPNCHLFLNPNWQTEASVDLLVPEVDEVRCTACGECNEICEYSAIVVLGSTVVTFHELCHACGGCTIVCPENAIKEIKHSTGVVRFGTAYGVEFIQGRLNIGEAKAPPVIRQVKKYILTDRINIIDAPPGTSCPVVESMKGSDYVILVTEPTPFGLYDLKLAVEGVRELGLPFGIVLNRADIGDDRVDKYCTEEGIQILLEIPYDKAIAEVYSRGKLVVEELPRYRDWFVELFDRINMELAA
jgi:MinD superfamily P-loop ATPase